MNNASQTRKLASKFKRITTISIFLCTTTMMAIPAHADQQIQDDLVVGGSVCAGLDCVNGESFGFDTIRLKENNLRIKFIDTSSSSSFPTADWAIIINDSANGGANHFSIEDSDTGKVPFKIIQGAPDNSLYVSSTGKIGVKTAAPIVDLHILSGNTPTLRLEQDGSSGFAAQAWDVGGNETNFFIRDVTNNSQLPFRISPSAPNASIFVAADGDVGFETTTPDGQLDIASVVDANNHAVLINQDYFGINIDNGFIPNGLLDVQTTGGISRLTVTPYGGVGIGTSSPVGRFEVKNSANTVSYFDVGATGNVGIGTNTPDAVLDLEKNGAVGIRLTNTGTGASNWDILNNASTGRLTFSDDPARARVPLKFFKGADNNLIKVGSVDSSTVQINGNLDVKGNITATGTITPDYVFESGYALKTIEEHAAFMWEEKHLPAVRQAKTNDYGKGVVNLGERSQNLLEELEVAHIYIEQLSNKIKKIESRLASLEQSKK